MSGFILSPHANEDVFAIWAYLAQEAGLAHADLVEHDLYSAFEVLARTPGLGHRREDLTRSPVHFFRVFPYQYIVIYRAKTPVEIVGVLHGKRNLKKILKQRPR